MLMVKRDCACNGQRRGAFTLIEALMLLLAVILAILILHPAV